MKGNKLIRQQGGPAEKRGRFDFPNPQLPNIQTPKLPNLNTP